MKMLELVPSSIVMYGRYFVPLSEDLKKAKNELSDLKSNLMHFLKEKGFTIRDLGAINRLFTYSYGEFEFVLGLPYETEYTIRERLISLYNKDKAEFSKYERVLLRTRDANPWRVLILWNIYPKSKRHGIELEIFSFPALYFKHSQLGIKLRIPTSVYDEILLENELFIKRIARALHMIEIVPPMPKSKVADRLPTAEILRRWGYGDVGDLLESANNKIENGRIDDGLVDLRNAIERLFSQIANNYKINLSTQQGRGSLKAFINLLKQSGYLTSSMYNTLDKILRSGIYDSALSVSVHGRHKFNLDLLDGRYAFTIVCESFEYILEKLRTYGFDKLSRASGEYDLDKGGGS